MPLPYAWSNARTGQLCLVTLLTSMDCERLFLYLKLLWGYAAQLSPTDAVGCHLQYSFCTAANCAFFRLSQRISRQIARFLITDQQIWGRINPFPYSLARRTPRAVALCRFSLQLRAHILPLCEALYQLVEQLLCFEQRLRRIVVRLILAYPERPQDPLITVQREIDVLEEQYAEVLNDFELSRRDNRL